MRAAATAARRSRRRFCATWGKLFPLAEELHAAGSAVAGCGPAFAAIFLESMADGGVACGLPRASAIQYAAQMMLGTAKMVLETNQHPGVLKDSVCSPAGSTIQGVRTLEERGMRAAVLDAVTVREKRRAQKGERLRLRRKGIFPARQA